MMSLISSRRIRLRWCTGFTCFISHRLIISVSSRMAPSNRGTLWPTNTGSSPGDPFCSTLATRATSPGSATTLWASHLWPCTDAAHNPRCCFSSSVSISVSGLHVGNCGGAGRHAGFRRTSLLWRVSAIWTRLLQREWRCSRIQIWLRPEKCFLIFSRPVRNEQQEKRKKHLCVFQCQCRFSFFVNVLICYYTCHTLLGQQAPELPDLGASPGRFCSADSELEEHFTGSSAQSRHRCRRFLRRDARRLVQDEIPQYSYWVRYWCGCGGTLRLDSTTDLRGIFVTHII